MAENFSGTDEMKRAADIAAGRIKADVVLKNARYLDVFNARLCEGDIALCGGLIAGIGSYEGEKEYDFSGKVVLPGLIDSHMHIESTQLSPEEFASLAVPRGNDACNRRPARDCKRVRSCRCGLYEPRSRAHSA